MTADRPASATDPTAPTHKGVLEELDGTPIAPSSPAPAVPAVPWHRGVARAAALTAGRPPLWAYALVAFLARGGILLLVIPSVVLPTFIGIASFVGPASVTASGPGPRLVALIAIGALLVLAAAVGGSVVAAAAEMILHRSTVAPDGDDPGFMAVTAPAGLRPGTARIAILRLLLLVPVVGLTALAVPAWVEVAYRELTLPTDPAMPFVVRVLAGAPLAGLGVAAAWLAAEVVGGFATRRAALLGASVPRALAGGLLDPLRAPIGTFLTVVIALAVSAAMLVPATWAVAAAWGMARSILAGDASPLAAVAVALVLAGAWLAALGLAGIAAAWRATLMTAELLRRHPAHAPARQADAAASPDGPRHAIDASPVR